MMRVMWNGTVIAEAPRTVVVEGNHYFPPGGLICTCQVCPQVRGCLDPSGT